MIKYLQTATLSREDLIEEKARQLLFRYWKQEKARLGKYIDPKSLLPMDVMTIAKKTLGLEVFESWDAASDLNATTTHANLAGWVDRSKKKIVVARELPPELGRFTLAHEVGHFLLHPNVVQFRDDPRTDLALRDERKSPLERQADLFAGFLTMPRKLVVDFYERMFGSPIEGANLNENQAYAVLGENGILSVIAKLSALDLAKLVAERTSLVFEQPRALTEIFGVSSTAMGIQLLRLGLVKYEKGR
jgi:Zn-dependent peptidase ImmA (M78 family)